MSKTVIGLAGLVAIAAGAIPQNHGEIVRQGDVLLRRVDSIPENVEVVPRDNGRVILAYGEMTGHAHAIIDETTELVTTTLSPSIERFLRVLEDTELKHEEHATVFLSPGVYEVIQQQEYVAPQISRAVYD